MSRRKPMSEETRRKISESRKGTKHSEETRRKISESLTKLTDSQKQNRARSIKESSNKIRESVLLRQQKDAEKIFDLSYWKQYYCNENEAIKYIEFIKSIQSLGDRELEYCEHHHIVPKSVDSKLSKNKYNIIKLTAKEHFIAHQLLCNIFVGDLKCKMTLALNLMMYPKATTKYIPDADTYEKVKLESRKSRSELFTGENNPFYGKHHSEESRKKMSESSKGQIPWNKGKTTPDSVKEKIRQGNIGTKRPNRPKSSASPGTIWITNEVTSKRIHSDELDKYISEGWRRGKKYTERRKKVLENRNK